MYDLQTPPKRQKLLTNKENVCDLSSPDRKKETKQSTSSSSRIPLPRSSGPPIRYDPYGNNSIAQSANNIISTTDSHDPTNRLSNEELVRTSALNFSVISEYLMVHSNLYVCETLGNGRCLYNAIAESLSLTRGVTITTEQIQQMLLKYMNDMKNVLLPMVAQFNNWSKQTASEMNSAYKEFVQFTFKQWGGEFTLMLCAAMLNTDIVVCCKDVRQLYEGDQSKQGLFPVVNDDHVRIHIAFNQINHYSSTRYATKQELDNFSGNVNCVEPPIKYHTEHQTN